jgi:protein TonB
VPTIERAGDEQPNFRLALMASQPGHDAFGAGSAGLSLALHAIVLTGLVWATLHVRPAQNTAEEAVTLIQLAPEAPPPPPPPPMETAPPPASTTPVTDIARGFQTLAAPTIVPPDIPPPSTVAYTSEADFSGEGVEGGRANGTAATKIVKSDDVGAAPTFTPYTVAPELRNREEVSVALVKMYPKILKESGIGGSVLVWLFIDETGAVRKSVVKESSKYPALDDAALRVAGMMLFTPALNRDRKVQVWVSLPINFSSK